MAEPHVISSLTAKRSEIEGYIRDTEKRLGQARADLAHVNAILRLFETKRDESTQFPKYVKLTKLFARGELPRLCRDALQAAPDGQLDTRQLAAHVVAVKGWNASDKALCVSVTGKVVHMLDEAARRGRGFERAGKREGVNLWKLVER